MPQRIPCEVRVATEEGQPPGQRLQNENRHIFGPAEGWWYIGLFWVAIGIILIRFVLIPTIRDVGGWFSSEESSKSSSSEVTEKGNLTKLASAIEKLAEATKTVLPEAPPPATTVSGSITNTSTTVTAPMPPPVQLVVPPIPPIKVEATLKFEPPLKSVGQVSPNPPAPAPVAVVLPSVQPKDCSQHTGAERLSCERWARIK